MLKKEKRIGRGWSAKQREQLYVYIRNVCEKYVNKCIYMYEDVTLI